MDDVSTDWEDFGRLLPPGDIPTDREAYNTSGVRELVLPIIRNRDGRVRLGGGGDLCCPNPEHI